MTREFTNKVYEAADNGLLDWKTIAEACLSYMSEDDVKDMVYANDWLFLVDEEDEENEEDEDKGLTVKEFAAGQKVIVKDASGYYQLTKGKEYVVEKYAPEYYDKGFMWGASVGVIGDHGLLVFAYARCFSAID
jgi:hypothetical protein